MLRKALVPVLAEKFTAITALNLKVRFWHEVDAAADALHVSF